MKRALRIVFIVICGIVGGWAGYWLGYLVGWSKNADWPGTIGGGAGAILLSIGMAVLFVALAALLVIFVPQRGLRRALRSGVPARATVVRVEETGAHSRGREGQRRQVSCRLEVHPTEGSPYHAHATQFVSETFEETLQPGATVAVRIDPGKRTRVAIEEPPARAA